MRWVHDLVFKHRAAPSAKEMVSSSPDQTFVAGVGAMYQSGSWTNSIQSRVKDKFQVKISLMPKGPAGKRGSSLVGDDTYHTERPRGCDVHDSNQENRNHQQRRAHTCVEPRDQCGND